MPIHLILRWSKIRIPSAEDIYYEFSYVNLGLNSDSTNSVHSTSETVFLFSMQMQIHVFRKAKNMAARGILILKKSRK